MNVFRVSFAFGLFFPVSLLFPLCSFLFLCCFALFFPVSLLFCSFLRLCVPSASMLVSLWFWVGGLNWFWKRCSRTKFFRLGGGPTGTSNRLRGAKNDIFQNSKNSPFLYFGIHLDDSLFSIFCGTFDN